MRANLLVTASFTLVVIVVVIAAFSLTTSLGGSGAGVSETRSPAAAPTPEDPSLGMPPSPTQPAAPPIVENPGADGEPPPGASPKPAIALGSGPQDQSPGPKPGIHLSPGPLEQGPGSDPGLAIPANPGPQQQGSRPNVTAPVPLAGIVLGQTTDEAGNPHTLVLEIASPAREAILQANNVFAVISGGSRFSVTGDAAVDSWRFAVDSGLTGVSAPIVVFKGTLGSVQERASNPAGYTSPTELNDDALAASILLSELIADVISKAESTDPDSHLYTQLASRLRDPQWTGVLIFNATATVPGQISGESTGALADKQILARNIGFDASPVGTQRTLSPLFGIIDQSQTSGDALPPGVGYVRALFSNSALTFYDQG